jgi:hypothetical protein
VLELDAAVEKPIRASRALTTPLFSVQYLLNPVMRLFTTPVMISILLAAFDLNGAHTDVP